MFLLGKWTNHTHLSCIELLVLRVFCEEEHVYEVDKYTGSKFRLGRGVDDPLEDHHEHQVAKQTQHEDQLRDQHKEHTAYLTKVPGKNNNNKGKAGTGKQGHVNEMWNKYKMNAQDYLPVVEEWQADSKSHVNDTDDDRHLHLVRVQES